MLPRTEQPQDHRYIEHSFLFMYSHTVVIASKLSIPNALVLVWKLKTSLMIHILAKDVACSLVFGIRLPGRSTAELSVQKACYNSSSVWFWCLPSWVYAIQSKWQCHKAKALLGSQMPQFTSQQNYSWTMHPSSSGLHQEWSSVTQGLGLAGTGN